MSKHEVGISCPLCEEKLLQAHPEVVRAYRAIKGYQPDAHISWTFRNEEWQNWAFQNGKSKLKWPNSRHNVMQDGKPFSEAMDLFQLRADGVAAFPVEFYQEISLFLKKKGLPMVWGGDLWRWDHDHYQVDRLKLTPDNSKVTMKERTP